MIAVVSGRRRYAQWIVQSSSRIVPDPPDEPGDVPRQQRPRREQRQHPRRVDVGQERAGRVVRVAAVEPDPDARPVRPGVRPAGLAAGDQPGQDEREGQAEQQDRGDPSRITDARDLAPECPPEHARPAPRGPIDHVREVDDDPAASSSGPGDRPKLRRWCRLGHASRILARATGRPKDDPTAGPQRCGLRGLIASEGPLRGVDQFSAIGPCEGPRRQRRYARPLGSAPASSAWTP